jgi:hypothetical protein
MMFPLLPTTTAVFQMVPPCAASLSRMGLTTTMPHLRASCCTNWVDAPVSADSANSHHCQHARGEAGE